MDVFYVRDQLLDEYRVCTAASVEMDDGPIAQHVEDKLDGVEQFAEPCLSLNPTFETGGSASDPA